MKNLFKSMAPFALIFCITIACEKAELPSPASPDGTLSNNGKGGGNGGGGNSGSGQTAAATYGGRATGIDALIWNITPTSASSTQYYFAYTSFLPSTGGTQSASEAQAVIPGVLTADAVQASATGQNNSTVSTASMANLNLSVGGHTLTANSLQATASAECGPVRTGSSQFDGLVIDGTPVVVTGAPNQAIYFPSGGMIIINEQSQSKKNGVATIYVTAIHVILPNVADIKLAATRADIKC